MDATRPRTGSPGVTHTAPDASATVRLTEAAAGQSAPVARGITSVTTSEPRGTAGTSTSPVQVLPNSATGEPTGTSTAGVGASSGELGEIAAAVTTAAQQATELRKTAEQARKDAAAAFKEMQDWVSKALLQAGKGHGAEADAAMAKAHEAWGKATAQQAIADQAAAGAREATGRAQAGLDAAQAALNALAATGLTRTELLGPSNLVNQAAKLVAGASTAATAAETAAAAVAKTLSGATDPLAVAGVVKLISDAQADIVAAQKDGTGAGTSRYAAVSAAKNAKGKMGAFATALNNGGTAAADPVLAQIKGYRDAAATAAAQARQQATEAKQLAESGAVKAAAALAAAKDLASGFAAAGKSTVFADSLVKAAQLAQNAATKAQRAATTAESAATAAEDALRDADATLDDANQRVQKYLDDLEAQNANQNVGGGY